jgi:outer membrane autotransporter protein
VNATSDGTTSNSADAGWIAGTADTVSNAEGTASGYGVSAGGGDNALQNDGDINVTAKGTGYAFAFADGAKLSWSGDGQARADSLAGASAAGILAGNGRNQIINNKAIMVLAQATTVKSLTTTSQVCSETTQVKQECTTTTDPDTGESTTTCQDVLDSNGDPVLEVVSNCENQQIVLDTKPTYAAANGNGLNGHGNATSTSNGSAEAYGIKAGDGDNLIVNNGDISVTASPEAKAIVSVSGGTTGNATGSASASASATAYGIWAGNGNNEIANNGTLTVTAAPKAQASADIAAGKGVCIPFLFWTWCIADGTGTGTATASFDSLAVGIRTGDGDNLITNNGTLTVRATPEADGATTSVTAGIDHRTLSTSVTSRAVGIETGDGDNQIVNTADGVIDVEATAVPGSDCSPSCTTSTSAIGIQTGDGDNLIINDGTIATSVPSGSGTRADIAIRTGGGNDMVELGDGSSTLGSIGLNVGDDSLTFIGGARVAGLNDAPGSVDGGAGTDSLDFNGAGSFTGSIQNFENATKQGNGTFALSSLPTMQQLKAIRGTLQTNSAYSFAAGGSYEAWIYGGGDLGKLLVNGGSAALAGDLAVMKGNGAFIDGTQYNVVEASGGIVGGTGFDNVTLPAPTPLLQFSYAQQPNAAQVEANVASFTTVTTTSVGMAMAQYLDSILPTATGDLSNVLGEIQGLPASEHDKVYASLSPDTYSDISQGVSAGIQASTGSLQQRMQSVRLGDASSVARSTTFSDGKPVMLAYNGSSGRLGGLLGDAATGSRQGMYGLWVNAFGQKGDQESDAAHAGFNYNVSGLTLGFDHDFTPNVLAGISLGYARTNLHLDRGLGDGDVNSTMFSAYGSYFDENGYIDGTLSLGGNRYANVRHVLLMGSPRTAYSYHDGQLLSVSVTGGYYFKLSEWTWEPFASLQYSSLDEDSFDETGAGAVSLNVDARRTQYLASDLGVRFRRALERSNGFLIPELSIAWNHDFDIDGRFVTASFAGSPNATFSVPGQEIERDGARLGAGVSYVNKKGLTSSLRYGAEVRDDYTAHTLIGEIRYEFK